MFKKKCACGNSEKNFKFDIGDNFVGDCCSANGYDELGRLKEGVKPESVGETATSSIMEKLGLGGSASPTVNIVNPQPQAPEQPSMVDSSQLQQNEPTRLQKVLNFLSLGNRVSKNKLKDLSLDELKEVAKSKSVTIPENATRALLMELLLKS